MRLAQWLLLTISALAASEFGGALQVIAAHSGVVAP